MVLYLAFTSFLLGLAMTLFENRYIMCGVLYRPLWYNGSSQGLFMILRLALAYGGAILIGLLVTWWAGLLAFAVYYLIAELTFRMSLKREMNYRYPIFFDSLTEDPNWNDEVLSPTEIQEKAVFLSAFAILENLGDTDLHGTDSPKVRRIIEMSGFVPPESI